jgi:hypothetical protein
VGSLKMLSLGQKGPFLPTSRAVTLLAGNLQLGTKVFVESQFSHIHQPDEKPIIQSV